MTFKWINTWDGTMRRNNGDRWILVGSHVDAVDLPTLQRPNNTTRYQLFESRIAAFEGALAQGYRLSMHDAWFLMKQGRRDLVTEDEQGFVEQWRESRQQLRKESTYDVPRGHVSQSHPWTGRSGKIPSRRH